MAIRIVLADDHQIIREGLRSLLEKESDMEVVGEAKNGREAVDLAVSLVPDVIVMDIGMPDLNGMEATRHIVEQVSDVKILALSMHSDRQFAAGILAAGASGYLLKDSAFGELAEAIRAVIRGQCYLSPAITGVVLNDYVERLCNTGSSLPYANLTKREREILQLLAEGWTTKRIAEDLHVSIKTVETHRQHIMDKLELRSLADLTKYAIRQGLTSLEG
jgi:DNA-binding NarL/FixJ family response regulator